MRSLVWGIVALLLLVWSHPATADVTFLDNASGVEGAQRVRPGGSFAHYLFGIVRANSTVANQYDVDNVTPLDAAYVDTFQVCRNFKNDGTANDSWRSQNETASVRYFSILYYGQGPDTIWVRLLDADDNVIGTVRRTVGATTAARLEMVDYLTAWAERLVVFAGNQTSSTEQWLVNTFHSRD